MKLNFSMTSSLKFAHSWPIAVCAWLLPAVSGSFMLLALGLYETVIAGVAALDVTVILTVGAGCAVGLLLFAKLLAWVLARYTEQVLSFLTGFMLGSVVKLWPWQDGLDCCRLRGSPRLPVNPT